MKALRDFGVVVGLVALVGLPAAAQEQRYKPWPGQAQPTPAQPGPAQTGDLPELLKSLRSLTDQAERARAADPAFIKDLRDLANAYDNPWPLKLLSDDFRDGDFTRNPAWTVIAGAWQVETWGRFPGLHSAISRPQAAVAQPGTPGAPELIGNVLGALLKQPQQQPQPAQPAPEERAAIFAPVSITNAFVIRAVIASRDSGGRFDLAPSIGQHGDNLYRLTYMPDAESGLVLARVTGQGAQLLASSNGRISLEDDKSHVIEWKRDRAGRMTVALDGAPIIEATDRQITRPFDGLLMENRGGAYWIRSIEVNGAK
jgi:hypothetical protein